MNRPMTDKQRIELLHKLNESSLWTNSLSGFKACVEHLLTTERDYDLTNVDLQNAIQAYQTKDYSLYETIPLGMLDNAAWAVLLRRNPITATIDVIA